MADVIVRGFLENIHYLPSTAGGFMQVSEFKKGYKKQNGEYVDDKYVTWKVLFKQGQRAFLNKFFNKGMLVKIKGEIFPFAVEHEKMVDGYTIFMDSCAVDSYPRYNAKQEIKMIKESELHSDEKPNIEEFNQPDF